jgi:hypothetical protein
MRRLIVVAALLALVTAACKIETNIGAVVNADGSGKIVAELGMDQEAQGFFLQEGQDPFEGQSLSGVPGATTRQETRGDMTFYIIEADVADVAALEDQMVAGSDSMLSSFSVTVTPDKVTVDATADATSLGSQAEGFDPSVFEQSFSASVKITMPGKILTHNADSVEGNTLIWKIPVLGGTLNVHAESDPKGTPSGGGGFPLWLIIVIAVVVVAAIAWFVMNQRKGAGTTPAQMAETPAPSTETPPAPSTETPPPAPNE